jgi:hypothetical protein
MQTKDFIDPEEAIAFCKTLQDDNCIDVLKTADGTFRVNWVPNQMYTALDGKEYVDEVWTMQDGTMIVCQDLEVGHAKNIIRMMLRNERERRRVEQEMMDSLTQAMQQAGPVAGDDSESDDLPQWMTEPSEAGRVLH